MWFDERKVFHENGKSSRHSFQHIFSNNDYIYIYMYIDIIVNTRWPRDQTVYKSGKHNKNCCWKMCVTQIHRKKAPQNVYIEQFKLDFIKRNMKKEYKHKLHVHRYAGVNIVFMFIVNVFVEA